MAGFGLYSVLLRKETSPHEVGEDALTGEEPLVVRVLPVAFGPE